MTDPLKFLFAIWRLQPDGHFFLAHFDEAHTFRERSFPRETDANKWTEYKRKPRLSLVGDGIDLYFCPNSFTEANRRNPYSNEGRWLYADLDESDPRKLPTDLRPTIAWQTSPGRYQAMWLMDKPLPPDKLAMTNQWMTYTTNADKGGWSLTKVLRVPGSVSHKRDTPHEVKLLWSEPKRKYSADDLCERATNSTVTTTSSEQASEDRSAKAIRLKYWDVLPAQAKKLLRTKASQVRGDRSAILWKLENLLLEAGLNPAEVFVLAKSSVWNKYRGQQREEARLWAEVMRADSRHANDRPLPAKARKRRERSEAKKPESPATKAAKVLDQRTKVIEERIAERIARGEPGTLGVPFEEFMSRSFPPPSWLIKDIWTTGSYGVVSGEWKGYKSMLSLDMCLSVAIGDDFLGRYPIGEGSDDTEPDPQATLYIHQEGREGLIQDRLTRIAYSKGLEGMRVKSTGQGNTGVVHSFFLPQRTPLAISSFPNLDLTQPDSLELLYDTIVTGGYKLVVIESLYLVTGDSDENEGQDIKPMLEALANIARQTGCAIPLSHHYNKSTDANKRKLARLSGSGVIARWLESGIFLERVGEESEHTTKLDVIHREMASIETAYLKFGWDPLDEGDYTVNVFDKAEYEAQHIVIPSGGSTHRKQKVTTADAAETADTIQAAIIDTILEVVEESGDKGILAVSIAKRLGMDPNISRRFIYTLVEERKIATSKDDRNRIIVKSASVEE